MDIMDRRNKQMLFVTCGASLIAIAVIALLEANVPKGVNIEAGGAGVRHMDVVTEPCKMEGYTTCEAVRVYEDGELVEFYMRGE